MPQIEMRFGVKEPRSYQVMQRLVKAGYVMHRRVFQGQHGVYYLTAKGARFTDLPAIEKIPIYNYEHQMSLTYVVLKLRKLYPEASWISERQLKHRKFFYGVGKSGHVSDGILIMPGDKQVAVEVELSLKGKDRLERIFRAYGGQLLIREVWYFCAKEIISPITLMAAKRSYIKIHSIDDFLL